MNRSELKELICKGKKLKHKKFGEMKITAFEGNFFYANTKKGNNMPFYYFEIGDTIEVVDPPKARAITPAAQKVVRPAAKKAVKAAAKV